jgi:hypothetical protein
MKWSYAYSFYRDEDISIRNALKMRTGKDPRAGDLWCCKVCYLKSEGFRLVSRTDGIDGRSAHFAKWPLGNYDKKSHYGCRKSIVRSAKRESWNYAQYYMSIEKFLNEQTNSGEPYYINSLITNLESDGYDFELIHEQSFQLTSTRILIVDENKRRLEKRIRENIAYERTLTTYSETHPLIVLRISEFTVEQLEDFERTGIDLFETRWEAALESLQTVLRRHEEIRRRREEREEEKNELMRIKLDPLWDYVESERISNGLGVMSYDFDVSAISFYEECKRKEPNDSGANKLSIGGFYFLYRRYYSEWWNSTSAHLEAPLPLRMKTADDVLIPMTNNRAATWTISRLKLDIRLYLKFLDATGTSKSAHHLIATRRLQKFPTYTPLSLEHICYGFLRVQYRSYVKSYLLNLEYKVMRKKAYNDEILAIKSASYKREQSIEDLRAKIRKLLPMNIPPRWKWSGKIVWKIEDIESEIIKLEAFVIRSNFEIILDLIIQGKVDEISLNNISKGDLKELYNSCKSYVGEMTSSFPNFPAITTSPYPRNITKNELMPILATRGSPMGNFYAQYSDKKYTKELVTQKLMSIGLK